MAAGDKDLFLSLGHRLSIPSEAHNVVQTHNPQVSLRRAPHRPDAAMICRW